MAKRVFETLLQTIAAAIYSKQGRFGFLILAPQVLFNDFAVNQLGNTITQSVVFVLNGFCRSNNFKQSTLAIVLIRGNNLGIVIRGSGGLTQTSVCIVLISVSYSVRFTSLIVTRP